MNDAFPLGESMRPKQVEELAKMWEKDLFFNSTWMGTIAAKNPCDAWVYQELIFQIRPQLIVETGSFKGGGALFFAHLLDLVAQTTGERGARVISVDHRHRLDTHCHPLPL